MATKTIIWVTEDGERHLSYRDRYTDGETAARGSATAEQLADLCDLKAEGRNAHDFVGSHRLLAAMLFRRFGRDATTEILWEIAEYGGLDGMNGICGADDAYADLGIPSPWKDWSLGPTP